ncbi:putative uncharacterized protein [Mycolicibacterium canariasense]|uniref:Uncharacterized protein n=1 Tax=Mycolicibacterium canariasense TaxID=228230 RepID=A0A117ICC6_MYCCR|nr:hypothetical protein [Mycolicibacterium canariasense]MCV7207394.1 hypothetical protein [Mycolicibacterium canariasense]ORV19426.1 hypothetical protein AWB94_02890 [Mycolicibacterium canariasense]GAS99347.1 putative uncharacterized protein [Mycolicibacterium canariasense]
MRTLAQPYRRIWLIIIVALFVVPAIIAAIVIVAGYGASWWKSKEDISFAHGTWHTPAQTLLSSSMLMQPTVGWRLTLADAGVPDPAPSAPYLLASDTNPFLSDPYIGNLGDRAYFMVGNIGAPAPQWWLVAVDVNDGTRAFAPVPLVASQSRPKCYLNGPDALLCLTDGAGDTTAWVIDSHSGHVTYTGPTPLTAYSSKFIMEQVGIYAVATKQDQGVYGIGPTANTSWFVPGNGTLPTATGTPVDFAPSTLATQQAGHGSDRTITFSLRDGTVIRPAIADDEQQGHTVIYPGGFAAEVAAGREVGDVAFFDDSGQRAGSNRVPGDLGGSSGLPLVNLTAGGWALFNAQGELLMQQSAPKQARAVVIGDFLVIRGDQPAEKRQFDMTTGAEMNACDLPRGYFASDGRVALGYDGYADTGRTLKAVDLSTCDTRWTMQTPPGSFRNLWRINTTLVQLSDDGTELMSLVAPG